ncbi:hypothetical protein IFR05_010865 [Cadophora sp. M221]|nr:hypothetical protein IFR05_010865 [Cadophora sp. M221]
MLLSIRTVTLALLLPAVNGEFYYRLYNPYNCDHNNAVGSTSPPNNQPPARAEANTCYNVGSFVTRRVETDRPVRIATYCDKNCDGRSGSVGWSTGTCFAAPAGYYSSTSIRLKLNLVLTYISNQLRNRIMIATGDIKRKKICIKVCLDAVNVSGGFCNATGDAKPV